MAKISIIRKWVKGPDNTSYHDNLPCIPKKTFLNNENRLTVCTTDQPVSEHSMESTNIKRHNIFPVNTACPD